MYLQSHKMTEVHTKGESKSIRSTGFSPSVLPVCGFLTRPLFFLSFWSTIPKEAARCGSFLPSLRASVPACVFAECMHHRIGCKQICRNINRFRFILEYLFYKIFDIRFPIFFFHCNFRIHALFFQIRKKRKCHVTDLCIGHIRNLPEQLLCFFSLAIFVSCASPASHRHTITGFCSYSSRLISHALMASASSPTVIRNPPL